MTRERRPNAALAARIAEAGFRQEELADRLNAECARRFGAAGELTDRSIRNWLNGTVVWPQARHRHVLERVLERPITELGFVPPRQRYRSTGPPSPAPDDALVLRRDFLSLTLGGAAGLALPGSPSGGRIGLSDVQRAAAGLDRLIDLDARQGGGAAVRRAVATADELLGAARSGRASERAARAAVGLAGEYLANAAFFAFDGGDEAAATMHLDRAARAATASRDPMLQAHVWSAMSLQARAHDPLTATSAAQVALASRFVRQRPRLRSLFHARASLAHATRGERTLAMRSVSRAFRAFDAVEHDAASPPWLDFFGAGELLGLTSYVGLAFGRFASAERDILEALALVPDGMERNRLHYLVDLALALACAGRMDEACDATHRALDLAAGVPESARVRRRLRELRAVISRCGLPEARDLGERFDQEVGAS